MSLSSDFHGVNAAYVLEIYERYLRDPAAVDEETRRFFDGWSPPPEAITSQVAPNNLSLIVSAANLAQATRSRGYLAARLDPLGSSPPGDPTLELEYHNLTQADLRALPAGLVSGLPAHNNKHAWDAIQTLRELYCARIGYDYDHVRIPEERDWLRKAAESGRFRHPQAPVDENRLLERLTRVEIFERFLHRIFPGKTRFSIEGLDILIPMLDEIVAGAARANICMLFLGMAHRGRLNVLAHILGKPYPQILAEFQDPLGNFPTWDNLGWTGDVKYHAGAEHAVEDRKTIELLICMPPNPSHLEHINPVLVGMSRAANSKVEKPGAPEYFPKASLPLIIHGDAAFSGEGVVAETLNMHALPGYRTAGSLHIIANNQLGFTASERESRSSLFASDLAKGFEIPIIHVNADDVLACFEAARTALAYRLRFQKDFVIDLIGYRRFGHNEGDEPAFTQPGMYRVIDSHPTIRSQLARQLVARGVVPESLPEEMVQQGMQKLQQFNDELHAERILKEPYPEPPPPGAAGKVKTGVPLAQLREINHALLDIPEGFHLHPKLNRGIQRRRQVFEASEEPSIDWATAEELAIATILSEGTAVRFTGEDVVRGTFSQRHAVFYDVQDDTRKFTPLAELPQARAAFEIHNSPLTENAAIGFEFGYSIQSPERLVIWEAQYGDFINVAQTMIDEFLSSARAKWGQTPSLVLLLPHGNEGQGPDHSSGRPERFLQLAANYNMRIANPTNAAQYFHLLRRQAALLKTDPLPLIVFTPKGLLRHPRVYSTPRQLAESTWQPVIDDPRFQTEPGEVKRILLCSGRLYIDIISSETYQSSPQVAVIRLEQLYPFPRPSLNAILEKYTHLEEVDWIQEEPQNMGAWEFVRPRLIELIAGRWPLHYIGRPPSSSPAEGSTTWYRTTQNALIEGVFRHEKEKHSTEELIDSDVVKKKG